MIENWVLRPDDFVRLKELLPDLSDAELALLGPRDDDEFGVGANLVLYSQFVDAIERGALFVLEELRALCGYREDLDAGVASIGALPARQRLLDALDSVDQKFLSCTVSQSPPWMRPPESQSWWWSRMPRRTDQRRHMEGRWPSATLNPDRFRRRTD